MTLRELCVKYREACETLKTEQEQYNIKAKMRVEYHEAMRLRLAYALAIADAVVEGG